MTFLHHQGGGGMSSEIKHAIHPLAHMLGTYAFISVVAPFSQFTKLHHVMAFHPLRVF